MISQFFVLSPRGDVILRREYLGNVSQASPEIFYRKLRFWDEDSEAPPVFMVDGVTYIHTREPGVALVATTRENISPLLVLELLKRIATLIKDYCGVINEDSIRKNFILIYELLDEILDYGFPQTTATDALKSFVLSTPIAVTPSVNVKNTATFGIPKGPTGVFKSVLDTNRSDIRRNDEIYVDVIEKLLCVFSPSGYIHSTEVDGAIQIRSYLSGDPVIRIKLNDEVVLDQMSASVFNNPIVFDDCTFHECAQLDTFHRDRTISFHPPDGEFALMNYRCTAISYAPFRVFTTIDSSPQTERKCVVNLRLCCEIPKDKLANAVEVEIPLPRSVERATCEVRKNSSWEFSEKLHTVTWKIKTMKGNEDYNISIRCYLDKSFGPTFRKDLGPVNVKFTIPMYSVSRLQLQYLQIAQRSLSYNPARWVRYITTSSSYTFRM